MTLPLVAVLLVATAACGRLGYGVSFDGEARDSGAPTDAVPPMDSSPLTDSAPPATDSAGPDSTLTMIPDAATDATTEAGTDASTAPTCGAGDAAGALGPAVFAGDTSGASDEYPGCGVGPEDYVTWRSPTTGSVSVTVTSPTFLPMLAILEGECMGIESQCDGTPFNGGVGTSASSLVTSVTAGDQLTFVVGDGGAGTGGPYAVGVEMVSCASARDVGTATDTVDGSTTASSRWFEGSCGVGWAPEAMVRFEAPSTGGYWFDTLGSAFDTVLYVRDGDCQGSELACNDDIPGGAGTGGGRDSDSRVYVDLTAGQVVFIVVDGAGAEAGDYVLNLEYLGYPS